LLALSARQGGFVVATENYLGLYILSLWRLVICRGAVPVTR
jgi:hypothetical protein